MRLFEKQETTRLKQDNDGFRRGIDALTTAAAEDYKNFKDKITARDALLRECLEMLDKHQFSNCDGYSCQCPECCADLKHYHYCEWGKLITRIKEVLG